MIRFAILTFALLVAVPPARAENYGAWSVRCEGEGVRRQCETFQRLLHGESGAPVIEFAIGFTDPEKWRAPQGTAAIAPPPVAPAMAAIQDARGAVVLPLGIILPAGVMLNIDRSHRHPLEVRYCTPDGCFAYITLTRAMLDRMSRALSASISFRSLDGQDIDLPLDLSGFTAALHAAR